MDRKNDFRITIALTAFLAAGLPFVMIRDVRAETAPCYLEESTSGDCLDDPRVPKTGQYLDLDHFEKPADAPVIPADLDRIQHHGNVRIEDASFIFAHNICRHVDNKASRGRALYIGLGTGDGYQSKDNDPLGRAQWRSFIEHPPAGVDLTQCCVPVRITACGVSRDIGFTKVGEAPQTIAAGFDARVTYACVAGTSGSSPTFDTSWSVAQSGQCEAPSGAGGGGSDQGNDRGGQTSHDTNGDGLTDTPGPGKPGQVTQDGPPQQNLAGGGSTGGGSNGGSRVICTYFKDKGLMPVAWWEADLRFTWRYIGDDTVRGYHAWAVPAVEWMRAGGRRGAAIEKILLPLALWRAEEIAARMNVSGAKENNKGKIVRLIGEPACAIIGVAARILGVRSDWRRLYRPA